MFIVKLLDNKEFDELPFLRAKKSVGCADKKTKTAYVRRSGIDIFDLGTIQHEIEHLLEKNSTHTDEEGIAYKGKQPEYTPPPAPKLATAEELYQNAMNYAKTNYPLAYGAREGALTDLAKGQEYYKGFQPTSFEEALGNQYFQNVYPDMERTIKQGLSLSGMESSPILAEQLGEARGKVGFDIGSYLSNLANERAQYSLAQRLGIDPTQMTQPYVNVNQTQSNQQAEYQFQVDLQKAQADYQNALNKAKQKASMISTIGTMGGAGLGAGLGALLALPTGGMSLLAGAGYGALAGGVGGGMASSLFGGGESPVSMSDALSMYSSLGKATPVGLPTSGGGVSTGQFLNYGGQRTPITTYSPGKASYYAPLGYRG